MASSGDDIVNSSLARGSGIKLYKLMNLSKVMIRGR